jgi:hypothetical protein
MLRPPLIDNHQDYIKICLYGALEEVETCSLENERHIITKAK